MKNGAELLDRLVKDIVAESAASYVSILQLSERGEPEPGAEQEEEEGEEIETEEDFPTAFSLAKFIPLLKERIHVISPFTRAFLVSWLTLLDTIPDLELVCYLPEFLGGLIKFLGDPARDVNVATQNLLEKFLAEIKRIAHIKKGIEDSREGQEDKKRRSVASDSTNVAAEQATEVERSENAVADSESEFVGDEDTTHVEGDWIPGQDVHIDYPKILDILLGFVDTSFGKRFYSVTIHPWGYAYVFQSRGGDAIDGITVDR